MQNKSIWIVEYYKDHEEEWEVEGFFLQRKKPRSIAI